MFCSISSLRSENAFNAMSCELIVEAPKFTEGGSSGIL